MSLAYFLYLFEKSCDLILFIVAFHTSGFLVDENHIMCEVGMSVRLITGYSDIPYSVSDFNVALSL